MTLPQPITPPFTLETALAKVQFEDAWHSRDPDRVSRGVRRRRLASINDAPIAEHERRVP